MIQWFVFGPVPKEDGFAPDEEIITSNQGELQEGSPIQATLSN
jgi:hypothetical protein